MKTSLLTFFIPLSIAIAFTACSKDDDSAEPNDSQGDTKLEVPASYEFERNGSSSVSFSGQTDRLNQLSEIKDLLKKGDSGEKIEAQTLLDMFANTGDNGGGNFSFSSSKQLKNKTFDLDVAFFEGLMNDAAAASVDGNSGVTASDGTAGLLTRGNGNTVLVDENGREFTQLIEKGLMGATFYNQIFNTYLTDDRIGDDVENEALVDGKNYTSKEHHMDEAFGYFGAPVDFTSGYSGSGTPVFWGNYSNGRDPLIGSSDAIMNAFKTARAAIVAKNNTVKKEQRDILYAELEKLTAATAIHYANDALAATTDGDRMHVLSECYAFIRAIRYQNSAYRKLTQSQVNDLLDNSLGSNFWQTTESGLNTIKDVLSTTYGLEEVKNDL